MIVLVGFMGAGKTTVGTLVADRLGRPFVDSDRAVEARAGRSIADIFESDGEAAFRALEEETIVDLLAQGDVVLALGGGSLGSARVREALAGHEVVLLHVPLDEVVRRVGDDPSRPMLRSHDVGELYASRLATYRDAARVVVPASGDPRSVASAVLAAVPVCVQPSSALTRRPVPARAVVIGPPGSGTTTVGMLAAARLGVECADVERTVEARAGRSVGEIFVEEGEARYRDLERAAALDLLAHEHGIVVLGGGAVLDPAVEAAVEGARVVFLDVAIADAAKRIGFDRQPSLVLLNPRRSWIVQMTKRRPVYERLATWTIDTAARSAQDVADELVGLLEGDEA